MRQPYVEQILSGRKTAEYRSRPTHVRGPVYLYATLKPAEGYRLTKKHKTGLILGVATLVGCRKSKKWRGTWEWLLKNPRRLRRPFKPTGSPQPSWFYPR